MPIFYRINYWFLGLILYQSFLFGEVQRTSQIIDDQGKGASDKISMHQLQKRYGFTQIKQSDSKIVLSNSKLELVFYVGTKDCLINRVKFILSFPVSGSNGNYFISGIDWQKLVEPVLRPNYIKNAERFQWVILDAGHGGKDRGATNSFGTEAQYNLDLAKKAKAYLVKSGFKVKLTRERDEFIELNERVNIANQIKESAIFISLHFNSGGSAAKGIETFSLSPPGVAHYGRGINESDQVVRSGNQHDSSNIALATAVHSSVLYRLGTNSFDRGIKRARFNVLSGIQHPAILFEGGFISNPKEAILIHSEQYRNYLALGIVDAVKKYQIAMSKNKR